MYGLKKVRFTILGRSHKCSAKWVRGFERGFLTKPVFMSGFISCSGRTPQIFCYTLPASLRKATETDGIQGQSKAIAGQITSSL